MSGYFGKTSFKFEIERYKNKESGALLTPEFVVTNNLFGEDLDYQLILLSIEGAAYHDNGRVSGPIDSCYPPDSDVNINSATDADGQDWIDKITESEKDSILELIVEYVCDQGDNEI